MNKKAIILLSIISLIAITVIIVFFQKDISNQKNISSLNAQVDDLKDELKNAKEEATNLENKVSNLENKLLEVNQFNINTSIRQGFSSNSSEMFRGQVLNAQIDGDFNGWEGETIFKMTNGTIWQQVSFDYVFHYAFMPNVIIYKKTGVYYIKVEDVDDEIPVRQIQ